MLQNLDLDTLQHILEQFSEDVLNDCSKIILKLLTSSNEAALLENHRIFTSLEVLLGLYEKLTADKSNSRMKLPVSLIIKNIKKIIYSNSKSGFYSDRNINSKVLSIVQSAFKISYLENSVEALEEFAKLYMHLMACLWSDDLANKCTSDYVIFHLKMLNTIYNVLESICCESSKQEFYKKSRTDYTDESSVYTKLVFHSDNKIAIQTLLFLTPGYLNSFNFRTVPEEIWKEISKSVSSSSMNYSRAMLILCNFFEKAEVENQTPFILNLFEDASFWELLQLVLIENDPVLRKQGMYVFKKSVDLLKNTKKTITCSKNNIIFYWDLNLNNELYELYNDVITILEFLDEQQVHIVKPILKLAESLCKKVVSINKMNLSWVFLIYCKALKHNSTNIIKWGLSDMLELPLSFFTQESNARKTVASLMPVLNSLDLYYNDGITVSDHLRSFFFKLAFENNAKIFFHVFIEHLCSLVWSPEALFFVAHALNISNLYRTYDLNCSFWEEQDISRLRTFVKQSFKTFHQVIKIGIQCNLLGAISTFTDVKHVSLKSIIFLISSFPMMESPDYYGETFSNLTEWLHAAYSTKDFNEILDIYKKQELGEEFNEKFIVLLFELSYCISFDEICDAIEPEPKTPLEEMLLLFKDIDRRPYCDKKLYDHYLSVISHFYVGNVSKLAIKNSFPYLKDVLCYVRNQLKLLVNLNEFHTCQFYLNAFKNIIRSQNLFEYMWEEIRNFYSDVLSDLEVFLNSESNMSSVGLYSRIKMLDNLLQTHPCKIELSSIVPFFLTEVNKPLKKDKAYCEQTKDVLTLWGKMNSEFIEAKWSILKYFIKEKLVVRGGDQIKVTNTISDNDLVQLCIDGLRPGGYGVLNPIMSILKDILPTVDDHTQVREIITSLWKLIMERKKTDEFNLFVKNFVEMLFQEAFFLKGDSFEETLKEFADLIFSHPSLAMVNIFIRHIQKTDLTKCSVTLYCHIIGKALIFGPVLRKDEKLTNKVCFEIQKHKIYPLWNTEQSYDQGKYTKAKDNYCWNPTNLVNSWPENKCDYYSSNEIRARAVEKVLTLRKDSPTDQAVVKNLVKTLIKMDEEVCNNRKRYFGGSYVHRVKHRVLQSLLLLDHLHCPDLNETQKLLQWLYNGLATENPQPSVRYQQMWLIVRILIKNNELLTWFKNLWRAEEFKKKGSLCSYLSVILHFYRLLPPHLEYLREFDNYSEFLVHQNFEVRLYARLLFLDMFYLAEQRKQTEFTKKWTHLYLLLEKAKRSLLNENQVTRNLQKVSNNFFFRIFHPLEHYTLDTIYKALPSATDMAPDEWISTRLFQYCGVDPSKLSIPLWSGSGFLISSWNKERDSDNEVEFEDQELNETLKNYQKKIIPMKSLISDLEEENKRQTFGEERDGLVVVASLIDRIPNLGGLARTCEIFGVSQLVLGSLKYTDDKQFTSLSVTAEKWIAVKEVKPHDLITYIQEMKHDGYTVVGAEQTLQSKSLTSVTFPEKTLLLLGNEKEGIPPNLLSFLDICVEIPQRGIIRSLNVHVTGALFIWEYAKQRFFS